MRGVFADTAFFVATANPRDEYHQRAVTLAKNARRRIVTTEYVLIETANHFSRVGDREVFVTLLESLEGDPNTLIVPSGSNIFRQGLALFIGRPDKEWSLTDCISFVVMERHGLTEALTADHHFEQAGFKALM